MFPYLRINFADVELKVDQFVIFTAYLVFAAVDSCQIHCKNLNQCHFACRSVLNTTSNKHMCVALFDRNGAWFLCRSKDPPPLNRQVPQK